MTDRFAPDYSRSAAVLIGTSRYTHLPQVPAAAHSLDRMRRLLTGDLCGWPSDRVSVFLNERGTGDLPDQLVQLFATATDVALFYYVGHGQIDDRDELCLTLTDSRTEGERRATTSLRFDAVRNALRVSTTKTKIVILDCCFAGLAVGVDGTLAPPRTVIDMTRGTGAYTIAASGAYNTAWFEQDPDEPTPHTFFTRHLAETIEQGIPGMPEELTLGAIYGCVEESLARDNKPAPTRRVIGSADRFVFAHNIAAPGRPVTSQTSFASGPRTTSRPAQADDDDGAETVPSSVSAATAPQTRPAATFARRSLPALLLGLGGLALYWTSDHNSGGPHPKAMATLAGHPGSVQKVAFRPDGRVLAAGCTDGTVWLWNVVDPTQSARLAAISAHSGLVYGLAFSPNGRMLAVGGPDKTAQLWNVSDPAHPVELASLSAQQTYATGVAFSPDGRILATGSIDSTARLWNITDPAHPTVVATLTGHSNGVLAVELSPDGHVLATGSTDRTARLWNITDPTRPTVVATLTGHADDVGDLAFSPTGRILATGSNDKTARLWDLTDQAHPIPWSPITGANDELTGVAFSPDGRTFAAASIDQAVRLWNITDPAHPASLAPVVDTDPWKNGGVDCLSFSPDGRLLATGNVDRAVQLWRTG